MIFETCGSLLPQVYPHHCYYRDCVLFIIDTFLISVTLYSMTKYMETMEVARVLYKLPSEVSLFIRSFLCETRKDWRTCRTHESCLIRDFNEWSKRVLGGKTVTWYYPGIFMPFPVAIGPDELEIYLDWTLFGRWFLILRTREDFYWSDSDAVHLTHPLDYPIWYTHKWFYNRWTF